MAKAKKNIEKLCPKLFNFRIAFYIRHSIWLNFNCTPENFVNLKGITHHNYLTEKHSR